MLDIIALILAGVSLVVSIGIARSDRKVEIKIAKTGIMAQYFDEIYKDFLIERIPRAREQMRFDMENKLQDIDPLVNELVAIRKKSLYFCYSNPTFYSDLVRRLSALEDYLINRFPQFRHILVCIEQRITGIFHFPFNISRMVG